jgi:hypothetical protein
MMARLRGEIKRFEFVLSKRQSNLYILHHSDCLSLFSNKPDDEKYVNVQNVGQAKKIADTDNKPIVICGVCCS